jgi:plasmid maintenance system antidote protein VapI
LSRLVGWSGHFAGRPEAQTVQHRRSVLPDIDMRFARYFNTSAEFRLNLQTFYDLRTAQAKAGMQIRGK